MNISILSKPPLFFTIETNFGDNAGVTKGCGVRWWITGLSMNNWTGAKFIAGFKSCRLMWI